MKIILLSLVMLVSASAFAAKPCSEDAPTVAQMNEAVAEADYKKLELTDANGATTAYLLVDKETDEIASMYICGNSTQLYYGRGKVTDWVTADEGDVKTVSTFSDATLYQDEGLLSAEVLTSSKNVKETKLTIYYMVFNLADQDVEDRGNLYLTLKN